MNGPPALMLLTGDARAQSFGFCAGDAWRNFATTLRPPASRRRRSVGVAIATTACTRLETLLLPPLPSRSWSLRIPASSAMCPPDDPPSVPITSGDIPYSISPDVIEIGRAHV